MYAGGGTVEDGEKPSSPEAREAFSIHAGFS
jgi:hypothetical protein